MSLLYLWRFADVEYDERSFELRVAGVPVDVERAPLRVLRVLLEHPGEILSRDALLAQVWRRTPDTISRTALTNAIGKLRRALGNEGRRNLVVAAGEGYRLNATVERVELAPLPALERVLKSGQSAPHRPNWILQEHIDATGSSEVWLVEQAKTHERRVFKFAGDGFQLAALRREVTISRLLHEALGQRAEFVRIHDWNLEQPPYFIESDYGGPDLPRWAERRGGLERIPLEERLQVVSALAAAVAAAHSVGVLHKDLKPGNVLVDQTPDGCTHVRIVDFGSGRLLDPELLDRYQITRIALPETDPNTGTPFYLAPELLSGHSPTTASDVYAIGVLLYQIVVGDLQRPIAPGWEAHVADPLLREDIAAAALGDPALRLADASALARNLHNLGERRIRREAELARQRKAQETEYALERARARRTGLIAAIASLGLGLAVSLVLFFDARAEREHARTEAAVSKQIVEYVVSMFDAAAPEKTGGKPIEARTLVDAGRSQLLDSFKNEPGLRARMLLVLAQLYRNLDLESDAHSADDEALALQRRNPTADPLLTAQALYALAQDADWESDWKNGELRSREALSLMDAHALPKGFDLPLSDVLMLLGDMQRRENKLDESLATLQRARALARGPRGEDTLASLFPLQEMSETLSELGRTQEALDMSRHAFELVQTSGESFDKHPEVLFNLMLKLEADGQYAEAEKLARQVLEIRVRSTGGINAEIPIDEGHIATLLLEQGRPREAEEMGQRSMHHATVGFGEDNSDTAITEANIGLARIDYGDYQGALPYFQAAYRSMKNLYGDKSLEAYRTRMPLGYDLLLLGRGDEAGTYLEAEFPQGLKGRRARYWQARGLLWRSEAEVEQSRLDAAASDLDQASGLLADRQDINEYVMLGVTRARLLLRSGDSAGAEKLLRPAIERLRKAQRSDAPDVLDAEALLMSSLRAEGKYDEAAALLLRITPAMERELLTTHRAFSLLGRT